MQHLRTTGIRGRDLRIYRIDREVQQQEIAAAWGCTPANIARIERTRRPTDQAVNRYLDALAAAEAGRS